MSNNALRILTALVGIPAIVGLLYIGSWPFALLVLIVALLAQYEVYEILAEGGLAPRRVVGLVLGAMLVAIPLYAPIVHLLAASILLVVALSPFAAAGSGARQLKPDSSAAAARERRSIGSLPATIFGAVYPSGLLSYLIALRLARGPAIDDGRAFLLALTVFLLVWSTDTFAYYVGRAIGKRPLAPTVSPKKTWAGAVAGTLGAIGVAAILKLTVLDFLPWIHVIAVAALCAVFGQLGDLAESKMKRLVGVKDSGALLPGHGGVLDRFDAMILAAPAVYLYLAVVARLFDTVV